jgi:hypothetical protein
MQQIGSMQYTPDVHFYTIATIASIQDPDIEQHNKFGQLTDNAMQREIMLHLSDPTCGVEAIKFIDLNSKKTRVMMKGVGLKNHRMGGINTV